MNSVPVIDTWAWVEYFLGTAAGAQARSFIEGPDVATSVLTLAELADLHSRDRRPGLEERVAFIRSRGPILEPSHRAAQEAGRLKWAQRKRGHEMGLVDAIIYETAREHGLAVVTGDPGFNGLPGLEAIKTKP